MSVPRSFLHEFFLQLSFGMVVKRDFEASDEEGMKMKEQAILSLGKMLSKHGKAEGEVIYIRVKLGMNLIKSLTKYLLQSTVLKKMVIGTCTHN